MKNIFFVFLGIVVFSSSSFSPVVCASVSKSSSKKSVENKDSKEKDKDKDKDKDKESDPFAVQNSEIKKLQEKILVFQKKKEEICKREMEKIDKRMESLEKKKEKQGDKKDSSKSGDEIDRLNERRASLEKYVKMPIMEDNDWADKATDTKVSDSKDKKKESIADNAKE